VAQISNGLLALACIIVASIQLHRFIKSDDGKLNWHIPQICLLLNMLSNVGKLIYFFLYTNYLLLMRCLMFALTNPIKERLVMIVDPQGIRQVYNRLGNTILVLLHVPLTLIPCLLVTFYW